MAAPPPAARAGDPTSGDLPIAGDEHDAALGRQRCRETLGGHPEHVVAAAALVLTELIQNVHRHTAARTGRARIAAREGVVRIEVEDDDAGAPLLRRGLPSDRDGWGLRIVDRVASRWGVEARDDGKTVWVEIAGR